MNMNQKDDVIASLNNLEQDEKLSTMLDKQLIFIQDTNNTRDYNINMSVFNTNSLTLDGRYVHFADSYLTIPMVGSVSSTENINIDQARHSMILKSHEAILSSVQVRMQQQSIQEPFSNPSLYWNYKKLVTYSQDDLKTKGELVGFRKDKSDAFYFDQNSGISNVAVGLTETEKDTAGRTLNNIKSPYEYDDAKKTDIITLAERHAYGCDVVIKESDKEYTFKFTAVIRLRDNCSFFETCPLIKNPLLELTLRYNQANSYVLEMSASHVVTTKNSNLQGNTCPFLKCSVAGKDNVTGTETYSLKISQNGLKTHTMSYPRLYLPVYSPSPEYEMEFLSNPLRTINYNHVIQGVHQDVNQSFNVTLSNSASRIDTIIMIPILSKESNGADLQSPLLGPYCSELPSPTLISNFNIKIGGRSMYSTPIDFLFENFLNEHNGSQSIDANLLVGASAGLINLKDFQNMHHYYVVDVSRKADSDQSVPASYSVSGTFSDPTKKYDLYFFMVQNKSVSLDVTNSQIKLNY
jgi:hypothetical protein